MTSCKALYVFTILGQPIKQSRHFDELTFRDTFTFVWYIEAKLLFYLVIGHLNVDSFTRWKLESIFRQSN